MYTYINICRPNIIPTKTTVSFTGWSNNHLNNLHFIISPQTNKLATCAAE